MNKPEYSFYNGKIKNSKPQKFTARKIHEKRINTADWIHLFLIGVSGIIVIPSIFNVINPDLLLPHFTFEAQKLHYTIELLN